MRRSSPFQSDKQKGPALRGPLAVKRVNWDRVLLSSGVIVGTGTDIALAGWIARIVLLGAGTHSGGGTGFHLARNKGLTTMPKANDLEGGQDQVGKHGGQKGVPKPEPRPETRPAHARDQGIVRDERGQEQPRDKARAQQVSRRDRGGDPPGEKP